ncbi:MAG TPA: serine hydrolase, partial [Longimicrobiales bacterium]
MSRFLPATLLLASALALAPAAGAQQASTALPRATPESQGVSSAQLLAWVEAADSQIDAMNSFMLLRHGNVVAEGWWAPYDARTPHVLYSLSKSFTSTAVGLAASEGKLSIYDPILKFFPEDAPANPSANLRAMRIHDLLRMSTGHQTEAQLGLAPGGSDPWTKIFLAHPVPFTPGTHFLYNTPATYMLSAVVQKVTGQTVLDYLEPRLWQPLGIEKPTWDTSPQGIDAGGYGLRLRTEDIAKFGQMLLQKGMFNGRQVVPAAWIEAATSLQTANGGDPNSDWNQGYGYQFWRTRHHAFRGDGAFGQYCIVLPDLDAVLVITSGVRDMGAVMNLAWDRLLPAMQATSLPDDPAAQQRLRARLTSLTLHTVPGARTSPVAGKVSGRWYTFPANERGIQAIAVDLKARQPALLVRTAKGESRIPFGLGRWVTSRTGFGNGLEQIASVWPENAVAQTGAWTAPDVLTLKLALY